LFVSNLMVGNGNKTSVEGVVGMNEKEKCCSPIWVQGQITGDAVGYTFSGAEEGQKDRFGIKMQERSKRADHSFRSGVGRSWFAKKNGGGRGSGGWVVTRKREKE